MKKNYAAILIMLSVVTMFSSCARKRKGSHLKAQSGFSSTIQFVKDDWQDQENKNNAMLIEHTFDMTEDPRDFRGGGFVIGDLHYGGPDQNGQSVMTSRIEYDTFELDMSWSSPSAKSYVQRVVAIISREEKSYWPTDKDFSWRSELLRSHICIPKGDTVTTKAVMPSLAYESDVIDAINQGRLEALVCGSDDFQIGLGIAIPFGAEVKDVRLTPNTILDNGVPSNATTSALGYIPATIGSWVPRVKQGASQGQGNGHRDRAKKYADDAAAENQKVEEEEKKLSDCNDAAVQVKELLTANICEQITDAQISALSICKDEQWLTQTGKDLKVCLDFHETTWNDLKTFFSYVVSNIPTVPESTADEVSQWKSASPAAENVKDLMEKTVVLADKTLPQAFSTLKRKLGLAQHHALATLMGKIADIVHLDKTKEGWRSFLENAPKIKAVINASVSQSSTDVLGLNVEIKFAGEEFRKGLASFMEKDQNDANSIVTEINKWEITDLDNSPANTKRMELLEKVGKSLKIAASILGCANGTGNVDVVARFRVGLIQNLPGFSGTEISVYDAVTININQARLVLRGGATTCN